MPRRVHSTLDKLPADLKSALLRMIVDGDWPDDCEQKIPGKPRYEDLVLYCFQRGHIVSHSAVGRWAAQVRVLARMKQAGVLARQAMTGLSAENASQIQKAAAELATAHLIELLSGEDEYTPRQIKELSQAIQACTAVAIKSDTYVRQQIESKIKSAAASTRAKLQTAGVDRKLIQEIIDEHLGVTKS